MATLVLSGFIFIFDICLSILGFLLFKDKTTEELNNLNNLNLPKEIEINNIKKNSDILNIKNNNKSKYKSSENDIFKIREEIYNEYKNDPMIKVDTDRVNNDNENEKGSTDKNNLYIKI